MLFKRTISAFLAAVCMIACVGTSVSAETVKSFPTTAQLKIADVNNDAQINAKDATAVLKMSVNLIPENGRGDVNNDGSVNAKDATQILRYVVGMTSTIDDIVETSNNYRPTSTTQPPAAVNNPDTDGDRLPDEYEVITLHTDPTSKDTDDNGTTDDNEDFDSDNLTNYEEYLLGTNPYKADTDEDGLTDGDEVNIYNTNPLRYDTDGDGVIDSDEVLLGLDPNDAGDGDTTIEQFISEDELQVNEYNDDFKVSIDVEASNNVKDYIENGISHYSGILSDNRAIIGHPINIQYSAGVIKSGTITFRMNGEFVNNNSHFYPELGLGMDRYGIFFYDEEIGTIIPVPCIYDEENYSINVDAEAMGNLMIIDYEALMYDLGIEPDESLYDLPMEVSFFAEEAACSIDEGIFESDNTTNEAVDYERMSLEEIESVLNSYEDEGIMLFSSSPSKVTSKSSGNRQVDLVLVIDTTGSMGSHIAAVQRNISTLISKLRKDGISLYVSVIDYRDITCGGNNYTKLNNNMGRQFLNSNSDISKVINSLYADGGGDFEETALDGLGLAAKSLKYRDGASKFAFLITDATYKNDNRYDIFNMDHMSELLLDKDIRTSVVTYPRYYYAYEDLTRVTGGELISMYGDFCDNMYEVIYNETPKSNVVIANNIVSGFFKEPLVKGGTCDTDGDTLSDSDEVDWNYVKKVYKNGTYDLYTWKELCSKTSFLWFGTAYTDGKLNPLFKTLSDIEVIPATSNPFSADTDKDYYPDNMEVSNKLLDVLVPNAMFINDDGINDTDFHKGNSISTPVESKFTDGVFSVYTDAEGQERAKYTFTRIPRDSMYYTLTPKNKSYYRLDGLNGIGYIKVTYKKAFGKIGKILPGEDGTYLLEAGKEYTIETYSSQFSEYKFTVEQDNWVHAEYGAICTAHESATIFDSSDYRSIYISDKALHQIINDYRIKTYDESISYEQFINKKDTGKKDEENPFYNSCVQNVEFLDSAQTYGDAVADSLNGAIGTGASIASVYLLLPISKGLAAIVTIAGGASAVYSIQSYLFNAHVENKRQEFIDAMYDGKFNFYIYNLSTTTAFMTYNHSEFKSFHPWNTDHYVRKIHLNTVYNVEPLTIRTVWELEDGTWRVIP